ncbi:hypothetical protein [Lactiplantibacillus plantarum]|uniref:hypothetical protein n=1 Tax=Lactiplantibacillus plantarum TaxID=1590 RepID=UPI001BAAD7D4|nr:hypothetical protein [Lactiplantibacillus plantarum]MBS0954994.1 hypothetical protein [Lactiplantibacillus plantarum]
MKARIVSQRLFVSFFFGVIYELGNLIQLPKYYNTSLFSSSAQQRLLIFSGGNTNHVTLFCLGIGPLITVQMIFQVIQYLNTDLDTYFTKSKSGKNVKAILMQLLIILLSFCEAIIYLLNLNKNLTFELLFRTTLALVLGTLILNWISEQWTKRAIGEGVSMLVLLGIINNLLIYVNHKYYGFFDKSVFSFKGNLWENLLETTTIFIFIIFCVWGSQINIRLNTESLLSDNHSDKQSYIPIKVNSTGVMPLVAVNVFFYAISVVFGNLKITILLTSNSILYRLICLIAYCLIMLVVTYSYTYLCMNPIGMTKSLRRSGMTIVGLSGGDAAKSFVVNLLRKISFYNFVFLLLISLFSSFINNIFKENTIPIGGSSILICVMILSQTIQQFHSLKFSAN